MKTKAEIPMTEDEKGGEDQNQSNANKKTVKRKTLKKADEKEEKEEEENKNEEEEEEEKEEEEVEANVAFKKRKTRPIRGLRYQLSPLELLVTQLVITWTSVPVTAYLTLVLFVGLTILPVIINLLLSSWNMGVPNWPF